MQKRRWFKSDPEESDRGARAGKKTETEAGEAKGEPGECYVPETDKAVFPEKSGQLC